MNKRDIKKFYKAIGERVKYKRKEAGFSQTELAKHLKLTRASVVNIEYGRQHTPPHRLVEIAEYLGVSVLYFIEIK